MRPLSHQFAVFTGQGDGGVPRAIDAPAFRVVHATASRPRQHSAPASRRSWLPQQADARDQSAVPAMRAITHAEGKAIRSSRRARPGAPSPPQDDRWRVRQDADIEQPDCLATGVGGPSSSQRARMPGWTSRWGTGFARPRSGRSREFDRGRRFALAIARRCGRRHAPRKALAPRTGTAPCRAPARPHRPPATSSRSRNSTRTRRAARRPTTAGHAESRHATTRAASRRGSQPTALPARRGRQPRRRGTPRDPAADRGRWLRGDRRSGA